jgi:hypothetical protein
VAYNDNQGSGLYQPGEGVGGVQVTAVNLATGQVSSTQTWASGGYELGLDTGNYLLIASQNGQVIRSQDISINDVNVEVDFNLLNSWQGGSLSDAIAAAQANTPAAAAAARVTIPTQPATTQAQPAIMPIASAIDWNWARFNAKQANS